MNPGQRPDSYAGDYTGMLRRRWWVVLALTCVGVAGAFGYVSVVASSYAAMAAVYVAPTGAQHNNQVANSRSNGAIDLDTEAQIVTSGTVAAAAGHLLHSTQPAADLARQILVTVPANSEILDITCNAPSGTQAADCANAFARAYVQNRSSSATAWLNQQIETLQDTARTLQQPVTSLTTKISALPSNSSARVGYQVQLSSYKSQLSSVDNQITALQREAANVSGSHVITYAYPPTRPNDPRKSLVLPSGFAGGLMLGLIGAVVWDRRDKRIRGAKDAERLVGLPVLLSRPNAFRSQAVLSAVRTGTGQAFTELAHRVAAALGEGNRVLFVAGASPGPAGSVTAANLAAALARAHPEAVLVCSDRSSTVSPGVLGLDEGRGLAEVMAGSASVHEVARGPAAVPGLWVITPGAESSLADDFIEHDTAQSIVSQLRRGARYVIIEAPAAGDRADTFAFAEFADAALITVEATRTSASEAAESVQLLRQMRTPVLGMAVLGPIRRGIKVRPPAQDQSAPAHPAGRRDELLTTAATPKAAGRDGRTGQYPKGYGSPADRNWGS